jgi:hypothetical protein
MGPPTLLWILMDGSWSMWLVAWSLIFIPTVIFYAVLRRTPVVALFAIMALLIGIDLSSGDSA